MPDLTEVIEHVDYESRSQSGDMFSAMTDEEFMSYLEEVSYLIDMELMTSIKDDDSSTDGSTSDASSTSTSTASGEITTSVTGMQDVASNGLAIIKDLATCKSCGKVHKYWSPMS